MSGSLANGEKQCILIAENSSVKTIRHQQGNTNSSPSRLETLGFKASTLGDGSEVLLAIPPQLSSFNVFYAMSIDKLLVYLHDFYTNQYVVPLVPFQPTSNNIY